MFPGASIRPRDLILPVAAAEYTVARTYLDWLVALPASERRRLVERYRELRFERLQPGVIKHLMAGETTICVFGRDD